MQQYDDQHLHNEEEFEYVKIKSLLVDIPHQTYPKELNTTNFFLSNHITRGIPKPTYDLTSLIKPSIL